MDISRYLIIGIANLLLAQAACAIAQTDGRPPADSAPAREKALSPELSSPWYIILDKPEDLASFWRRIERPDLVVIKADQRPVKGDPAGVGGSHASSSSWLIESVKVRGQVGEDFASLAVEMQIVVKGVEPIWAPIRLDGQSLIGARERARDLGLQRVETGTWQVKLAGEGEHRIEIELRAPIIAAPARKSLTLAIPLAASTGVSLDFSRGETDIAIGENEVLGRPDPSDTKRTQLTAHLSPRAKLLVSWTSDGETGARNAPLLTTKSEIAIDIDPEQVRTSSSWAIRCVRGTTRNLEIQMDQDDLVTEVQLDDQPADAGIERVRGSGKLLIRMPDPLISGAVRRLVMKTRRLLTTGGARRISFVGYPLINASEQSGFIGITQSANLFVSAPTSRGLRPVDTDKLPENLRTRPSTSLAYEFLDQPFLLDLAVEESPPLVRANSRTLFRIDGDRARSETALDLDWVRGELSEVELDVAPGVQLVSVGPADAVESSHLSDPVSPSGSAVPNPPSRRLTVRLRSLGRDPDRVSLILIGQQPITGEGKVNLGLFTPMRCAPVTASYALVADRGLSLDLDDESGRVRRLSEPGVEASGRKMSWPWTSPRAEAGIRPLLLADEGLSRFLPIKIARHARTVTQENVLNVQVSRRWVDLLQRAIFTVRFGVLNSLEVHVPAAVADRWELLDKELVDREELGPAPDGGRRYRLSFTRPVVDKATVRVRYRLPLSPGLDARSVRDLAIPWLTCRDVVPGSTKVEMSLAPEVVLKEVDLAWVRSADDGRAEPAVEGTSMLFEERDVGSGARPPFTFKALALEPVALPAIVVPRLLVKTACGSDDTITTSASYWVDSHGLDFPFALPEGARWLGARIDGRPTDHIDYDPTHVSYRLRLGAEVGSRPVLVELEYQLSQEVVRSQWPAPRLLGGGVVLQTMWDVQLPRSSTLLGVPPGWSDDNVWLWSGYTWKRHPAQDLVGMNEWLRGPGTSTRVVADLKSVNLDSSQRYLFSRSGAPGQLGVWIVSRSWLVAICSGVTLFLGFLAIFSRVRFRTAWLVLAGFGLLIAVLVQPSVTIQLFESAVIGAILLLSGLLIESLIVQLRSRSTAGRGGTLPAGRPSTDSSLRRSPSVGSDDSTAIRMRVPSTMDYAAAPIAAQEVANDPLGSSWERA